MNKIKAGDLIYIPSEVLLYTAEEDSPSEIREWKKTDKPGHMLVTKVYDTTYEIFHESKYWLVDQNKVYHN